MPIYNKVLMTEQARRLGFLTATFEKMTRLTEILRFINESKELRESLAIKGGTAINLTVFNLPRLSVDIDMDFTANTTKEETRAKRDRISKLLELYMTAEGYTKHRKSKSTHILDSFVYSYTNIAGNSDNIKVEINYSLRCHTFPTIDVITQAVEVFIPFPVRTLAPVEIFASKIVALSDRTAPRDLYDLNNMIHNCLFDEPDIILLRKCALFYMAVAGNITPSPNAGQERFLSIGLERDKVFSALWAGQRRNGNESSDDIAFMNKLSYWCNADPDAVIRAFLSSPYYAQKDVAHKKKCLRSDYLPKTAKNACASVYSTAIADYERWQQNRRREMRYDR